MAEQDEPGALNEKEGLDIGRIERHLDMLDQRLDSIDSTVSAIVERVMNQAVTLNITCPTCGKNIEIAVIGGHKPTG